MAYARRWCFTYNNYDDSVIERLKDFELMVVYLIYGKEVGENGTPHLQGFFILKEKSRMNRIKSAIGDTVHLESSKGSAKQASDYCRKEGVVYEFGVLPNGQGKRNDIECFKEDVKNGMMDLKELREVHSTVCAKYPSFVSMYIQDQVPYREIQMFPLRKWQQLLNGKLNLEPNDRNIIFVYDRTGNSGKSWFSQYYRTLHRNVQILTPGKKDNMAFMIENNRVYFIDSPRSSNDFIQYGLLEEMKNGYIHCAKYQSCQKIIQKCHVCVMMNQMPEMEKLSADRYDIIEINETNNCY